MLRLVVGLVFALVAGGAQAAEKLVFAPAPAWVKSAESHTGKAEPAIGGARYLLVDRQVAFGPADDQFYLETRTKVETSMGLGSVGRVQLSWEPQTQVLTVHKVRILRDGKPIDVLAKQTFTILRREVELESSMLDGLLTASLQPEGLQVGDTLEVAYTITSRDPVLAGKSEVMAAALGGTSIDRARVRAVWPSSKTIRWWASSDLEAAKPRKSGDMTELIYDRRDVKPVKAPTGAPPRYSYSQRLEFTEFASWAEVSALLAPLYDKASRLAPDSPLKAEAARIRAASDDPKVQAEQALALVQGQVRYVFQAMDHGGLIPADADLTWTRRFGDCKGKTALLLALLKELGIQAQAAAVHSSMGDGMDQRLPRVGAFDHVLVRATIGGRDYWLDGTRSADGALDSIVVPPFRWALPLQAADGALARLQPAPHTKPTTESIYRVDASAGLDAPAKIRVEMVMRGEGAAAFSRFAASGMSAELDKQLRANVGKSFNGLEVTSATANIDAKGVEHRFVIEGVTTTGWRALPLASSQIGWKPNFKREPGPGADAPFTVGFPHYSHASFTVLLPNNGVGFTLDGDEVDVTAGGWALRRKAGIEKGVAKVEVTVRSLAPEFPASEAEAAAKAIGDAAKPMVTLRAPANYRSTDADIAALAARQPKTVEEFLRRGGTYMDKGDIELALADFEKAVALDPKSALALGSRGGARAWSKQPELAKADLDAATRLDPRQVVTLHGYAALAERQGRQADAVAAYSRAIDLRAGNGYAITRRAQLYWAMGQAEPALADAAEALKLAPSMVGMNMLRAQVYRSQGETEKALAEAETAAESDPSAQVYRAGLLAELGRKAEAQTAFAEAIAADPSVSAYLTRAKYRDTADRAGRLADIETAIKLDPKQLAGYEMRAELASEAGDHARALEGLTQGLKALPDSKELLLARATAQVRAGRPELAIRDFTRVRGQAAGDAALLNNLCWTQATLNVALEAALADCDAALKLEPASAQITDSRAFANLRLGRLDAALADYEAALKLHANLGASLFGRGVVKLRMGQEKAGQADLAAARALSSKLDQEFAEYGVTP